MTGWVQNSIPHGRPIPFRKLRKKFEGGIIRNTRITGPIEKQVVGPFYGTFTRLAVIRFAQIVGMTDVDPDRVTYALTGLAILLFMAALVALFSIFL